MQRPHKRLKFENVLTVVLLLFLAHTSIASLTDDSASKGSKDRCKTQNSIRKGRRICFPAVINSRKAEGRVLSVSGNTPEVFSLWLWNGWIDYLVVQHFSRSVTVSFLCFTTNSVLVLLLVLCEVSVHVFVHVRVQAKNSNGTTVRTFSNFNLLRGRCALLPFPSTLTSLCAPDVTHLTYSSKPLEADIDSFQYDQKLGHMKKSPYWLRNNASSTSSAYV